MFSTEKHVHVETIERVFLWTEAQIAGVVEPQRQRIPIRYEEPLPDVKLCVVYQKRTLWQNKPMW